MKSHAFTVRYPGRVPNLVTPIKIGPPFDASSGEKPGVFTTVNALWDTGATNSIISQRIAAQCGFPPTGVMTIKGVNATREASTYLVSLILRNGVGMPQVPVSDGDIGDDIDVLIGMDIITSGDFAVTHADGKTTLSFRIPSTKCIDFVVEPEPDRNDPCPCGSGKKYKYCHGKR